MRMTGNSDRKDLKLFDLWIDFNPDQQVGQNRRVQPVSYDRVRFT
jgi:hypothetical protein